MKNTKIRFCIILIMSLACESNIHTRNYKLPKFDAQDKVEVNNNKSPVLKWEKPKTWIPSSGSSMRLISFSIPFEGGEGDLSVIQLGGDGGGLKSNVNRWRGQLKMNTITIEEIKKNIIVHKGKLGAYSLIKIINDKTNNAFICAIFPVLDQTLFVKLSIKANYLSNIEEEFIEFCSSLDFSN